MKLEKITEAAETRTKRHYEDACAAAHALDLVGERWALLVMRELMLGPKRFSDLRASLPGISANVLTQRLEGLEAAGVLLRRRLPPPAASQVYELTEWGYESEPIFQALGRWAARSPVARPDPAVQRRLAACCRCGRCSMRNGRRVLQARIGFRLGEETFLAHLADGKIEIARGSIDGSRLGSHRHAAGSRRRDLWRPAARGAGTGRRAPGRGRPGVGENVHRSVSASR